MKVLLDTCVLSEIRRPEGVPAVREAVRRFDDDELHLSVLTVGELARGIALLDPGRRKDALGSWLEGLNKGFSDRILGVNGEIARLWGDLTASAGRSGRKVPAVDGLIAATALHHGLTVMTRNVGDFSPTGVRLINPWAPPGVHED